MFSNLKNIFKVPDLRNKILFLMAMVMLYRVGVAIRVPGIDEVAVRSFRQQANTQGALGFFNMFSGGALSGGGNGRSFSLRLPRTGNVNSDLAPDNSVISNGSGDGQSSGQ